MKVKDLTGTNIWCNFVVIDDEYQTVEKGDWLTFQNSKVGKRQVRNWYANLQKLKEKECEIIIEVE